MRASSYSPDSTDSTNPATVESGGTSQYQKKVEKWLESMQERRKESNTHTARIVERSLLLKWGTKEFASVVFMDDNTQVVLGENSGASKESFQVLYNCLPYKLNYWINENTELDFHLLARDRFLNHYTHGACLSWSEVYVYCLKAFRFSRSATRKLIRDLCRRYPSEFSYNHKKVSIGGGYNVRTD